MEQNLEEVNVVVEVKESKLKSLWNKHKGKIFGVVAGSLSAIVAYAIGNNKGFAQGYLVDREVSETETIDVSSTEEEPKEEQEG